MSQSKKGSFVEACVNTVIGFILTLLLSHPIYWICEVKISHSQVMGATLLFTIISILRGYIIRRFFENNITGTILKRLAYRKENRREIATTKKVLRSVDYHYKQTHK